MLALAAGGPTGGSAPQWELAGPGQQRRRAFAEWAAGCGQAKKVKDCEKVGFHLSLGLEVDGGGVILFGEFAAVRREGESHMAVAEGPVAEQ